MYGKGINPLLMFPEYRLIILSENYPSAFNRNLDFAKWSFCWTINYLSRFVGIKLSLMAWAL
jgi:hypothetical protein